MVFAMLNAGSLLNKTEELTDLAQQKNWDIIGVTRLRVNQHPFFQDLVFCQIPTPYLPYLYSSSPR